MLVLTRRPEYRPLWLDGPNVRHIVLEPLSGGETSHIVRARLGIRELPEELGRLVAQRAEGNPLFAEEIASFLLEHGALRIVGRELQFDAAAVARALPESVQSLLTSRIDRLSPDDRALLQAAAVIGRRFEPDMLAAVSEASDDVEGRLAALQKFDLVYAEGKSGDYLFKHSLVREALYGGLLTARRSSLHLKVAEEIERRSGNRLIEVAEVLAHHYAATERSRKAFFFLSMAGKKSADVFCLDESEKYFRRALSLYDMDQASADGALMATTVVEFLQVLILRADFAAALRIASIYEARVEALGDTPELVYVLVTQALSFFHCKCDFRACEALARRGLRVAEQIGDIRARAHALVGIRTVEIVLGSVSFDVAVREGQRILAICRESNDNFILNWAFFQIAWDYLLRGLMNEARDWAWKLIESGRNRGDRRAVGLAHWALAYIDLFDGNYAKCIGNADECLENAVTPYDRTVGDAIKAAAIVLQNQTEEGLSQILEIRRRMLADGVLYVHRAITSAAAVGLVLAGQIRKGIQVLVSGTKECDKDGDRANATWNRIALAEIYLEILGGRRRAPLRTVLANLSAIVSARIFGARRARVLLETASLHDQLHERGAFRARINLDLGLLYKLKHRPGLARQFLEKARAPAMLQGSAFLIKRIEDALAELR
jgi:hypothetical protein